MKRATARIVSTIATSVLMVSIVYAAWSNGKPLSLWFWACVMLYVASLLLPSVTREKK